MLKHRDGMATRRLGLLLKDLFVLLSIRQIPGIEIKTADELLGVLGNLMMVRLDGSDKS